MRAAHIAEYVGSGNKGPLSQASIGPNGIGEFWSNPQSRTYAELLIDCEEDRTLRAVLVGMLREMER